MSKQQTLMSLLSFILLSFSDLTFLCIQNPSALENPEVEAIETGDKDSYIDQLEQTYVDTPK